MDIITTGDNLRIAVVYLPHLAKYWPFSYAYRKRFNRQMIEAINGGANVVMKAYGEMPELPERLNND